MNVKWLQIDLKASVCALPHPPQQQLCFSENYFHIVVSQRSYRKHLLVGLRQDIMEVRALCIRLLMTVLILLCAQKVAGSVILEIPAVPVMEGEAVTLRCRNKTSSSNTAADFYKNGVHNSSSSSRSMTIHKVLKSDEGLYKCKISGGGESPESWLSVYLPCLIDSHNKRSHCAATTPWIVATILLSTLIAVVGLYHFRKDWYRALVYWSTMAYGSGSTEDQTGQNTNNEVELCPNPVYDSLGQGDTQPLETVKTTVAYMASPGIYQAVAEDPCYSTIP
ncbi:uncharacterized protein LOC102077382 isoform X2 [Oreochromis niloticus]|uniref:uncharacterized protein LOC102077382 isoform X2 n=1 Tax=Oreochromis niloticus TaxID=8128 RepID=UPI00039403EB|nr:uncharacterized protein LOC102077382 isoform X2 [Oreochromis niloticus]